MKNDFYGEERLMACVNVNKHQTAYELIQDILQNMSELVGNVERFDDITMLALKV